MYRDRNTNGLIVTAVLIALFGFASSVFADRPITPAVNHIPVCPRGGNKEGEAHCHAHIVSDTKGNPLVTNAVISGYGPVQFQSAYGVATSSNTVWAWNGKTIGIVDAYDDPTAEQDLATYSSAFGIAACTTANGCFKKVNQTGGSKYPRGNQGWALEISLDIQAAHAMCPGCKVLLVEAVTNSFSNLLVAEDYAISHANAISNSWGGSEFSSEISSTYDSHFNKPGKAITVSSGDNGYGTEYPAASRYVTAVGGTTLLLNSNNSRASENAWSGAGSGCSLYEGKPAWQQDTGCIKRTIADVSADADPATGAAVYDSYGYSGQSGWFQVGGTSLASPIIAAMYAISGNTAGSANSLPYAHTSGLYDVIGGSNGSCGGIYLCTAISGFDGPTGLGSPNGLSAF
jgi:subtilase family serine protease